VTQIIIAAAPLQGMHWPTLDPFLFCAHHHDDYPAGDERMAPKASLSGRNLGSDFSGKDGWSMYHGSTTPGFPQHPHRGFETVTLARNGYIDHSDSMGATARFGKGDVQWMTAGRGVVHAEMFPLVQTDRGNPAELFQIWLNLPGRKKMSAPCFAMLWSERIPRHTLTDARGKTTRITTMAGAFQGVHPPAPPPDSYASDPNSALAIWTLELEEGATFTLPAAEAGLGRVLYLFSINGARVADRRFDRPSVVQLNSEMAVPVEAIGGPLQILLLQGRPIGEPVAQRGPFVMNTPAELEATFAEYRRNQFGGWPWPKNDPTHPRGEGRFALHADGTKERPPSG
jgi:redox-sensitive bicupin YhaK (pirin superfamily)